MHSLKKERILDEKLVEKLCEQQNNKIFLKRMRNIVGLQGIEDGREDKIYRSIKFVDDISNDVMRSWKNSALLQHSDQTT